MIGNFVVDMHCAVYVRFFLEAVSRYFPKQGIVFLCLEKQANEQKWE
jgi:hypothetical protein